MKNRIAGIYKALQKLTLQPTPENARTMTAIYNTLEDIYTELEAMENERQTADSGGGK